MKRLRMQLSQILQRKNLKANHNNMQECGDVIVAVADTAKVRI